MRSYEIMLAINPQLEDKELDSLLDKLKKLIIDSKGEITKVNKWGKRKLAFEIKDFTEAIYIVLNFNVDEKMITEMERVIKLEE
ncbi:MAG TPA: 30S ribosomal protein S6, partial [Candidatus Atribacteria bacterium]|nr:30S ribosomal protein S6 [Candidatus Atribacteria bacterium]